jgi:undecaprenyl-phosphate galactose phosphotransferase
MSVLSFVSGVTEVREKMPARPPFRDELSLLGNQLCALLMLLLLSPLMLVVAISIWRSDGAPLVFAHYRVGHRGKLFQCFKFRSMYRDSERMLADLLRADPSAQAEWARDQKLENDPRVTTIGKFLRKTSLDELPQLFNVLRGEMSLVGPRPITVNELDRYGRERWHYLAVRPGITGLWQVSGRNDLSYAERVTLDREYVESRGLRLDLMILWRTVSVVLNRNGAR